MKKCELDIAREIVKKSMSKTVTRTIVPVSNNSVFISNRIYSVKQSYGVAESIVKNINKLFNDNLARREQRPDGQLVYFIPTVGLVKRLYADYLEKYEAEQLRQAKEIQEADAARADIKYTKDYLFDNQNESSTFEDDLQMLNLRNPDVLKYLYLQSTKKVTKEEFGKIAFKMISFLESTRTTEQIIEALKCI